MGRCESAEASIGIKILLSHLIEQIKEETYAVIEEMILRGSINDENDYFNEVYFTIINNIDFTKPWVEIKETLLTEFQKQGTVYKEKCRTGSVPTLDHGCLLEKEVLIPVKHILCSARWGYDRSGINSVARPIDFDLSIDMEKYKNIDNFSVVFILTKSAY